MVSQRVAPTLAEPQESPAFVSLFRREVKLTWRMIGNNLAIGLLPTISFAVAAGLRAGLPNTAVLIAAAKAVVIGVLFAYIYDVIGQAHSGEEDSLNKPHRPIPAGLATVDGLMVRSLVVLSIFPILVWLLDVWPMVLFWPLCALAHARWLPPRFYIGWKLISNGAYPVLAIGTGWQLSAKFDPVVWPWIGVMSIYFTLAFIFEDVRDIDGDRAAGRKTLVMLLGDRFVRIWFAVLMILLPAVYFFVLAKFSGADAWLSITCTAVIGVLGWICAIRAVVHVGAAAARNTYKLFCLTWGVTMISAPALLAPI